ncbi:MAG: hypothetical protein LLF76_05895 [Planctomycetaceae bacterium]|nr:hypothetical protein [Planctomycetaceae bacterium]
MEPIPSKPHDMVDVTDSLEAVDAARGMRFFLFWFVLFPGLIVLQLIFWLHYVGRIAPKETSEPTVSWVEALSQYGLISLAAQLPQEQQADEAGQAAAESSQGTAIEQPADAGQQVTQAEIEQGVSEVTGSKPDMAAVEPSPDEQPEESGNMLAKLKLPFLLAKGIVQVCNFLILFAAILYCLILLLCLKISLVGRLGGLFHITKSFLISLLLLVVLVPWQVLLPHVMVGTLWRPDELFSGWTNMQDSAFWQVLYFLRFTGLWLLALVLLFWSRTRFVKWRRATLRRLGVLR